MNVFYVPCFWYNTRASGRLRRPLMRVTHIVIPCQLSSLDLMQQSTDDKTEHCVPIVRVDDFLKSPTFIHEIPKEMVM
jgi:hypothetical protein